jgi:hypothetical protein
MVSTLKFFTDEHIDRAIVEQLRRRGINVLRSEDVGMKGADDSVLLEYATQNGYAFLSMDDDVTGLHTEWLKSGRRHGGIFYAPMAQFKGQQGIGPIVRECTTLAELIDSGAGTLADDIQNQLYYIEK